MTQLSLLPESHRTESCARCGKPATGWSGAWLVDLQWIGWCGNDCRNAWLRGDKTAAESQETPR